MSEKRPIYVTQPYLPPLEEFLPSLEKIWNNRILTNCGPFHDELETALGHYLDVEHISLFTNGTLALVTALQALRITGEVITTPFSFVATTHALLWNGIRPVFVDIDPVTFNLDPSKIEAAITPQTTAILPVHCYGTPCDVLGIQHIADNYNLKVIYDAAHAFGVRHGSKSLFAHGDLSVLSFHATKVFNTFEGGAIISPNAKIKHHIDHLKNFGFVDESTVAASGINGKMSEFNAALGLLQLKHMDHVLARRAVIAQRYTEALSGVSGIRCLQSTPDTHSNFSYYPILIDPASYPCTRDALFENFKQQGIFPRRYFYPLISDFSMYRNLPSARSDNLPHACAIARNILCLPIYPDLEDAMVEKIIQIVSTP